MGPPQRFVREPLVHRCSISAKHWHWHWHWRSNARVYGLALLGHGDGVLLYYSLPAYCTSVGLDIADTVIHSNAGSRSIPSHACLMLHCRSTVAYAKACDVRCMLHVACCMAARRLPGEFSSRYIGIALGSVEERAHKPRLSVKPTHCCTAARSH